MTSPSNLRRLRDEFERSLATALAAARNAGQDKAQWTACFREWTARVPEAFTSSGRSAHPSEVREVLLAMQKVFQDRLAALPEPEDFEDDDLWDFRHRTLGDFVRGEINAYQKAVSSAPAIGNVFAAAAMKQQQESSAQRQAASQAKIQYTIRCQACGAPRQQDNLYTDCAYCQTPYFPPEKENP